MMRSLSSGRSVGERKGAARSRARRARRPGPPGRTRRRRRPHAPVPVTSWRASGGRRRLLRRLHQGLVQVGQLLPRVHRVGPLDPGQLPGPDGRRRIRGPAGLSRNRATTSASARRGRRVAADHQPLLHVGNHDGREHFGPGRRHCRWEASSNAAANVAGSFGSRRYHSSRYASTGCSARPLPDPGLQPAGQHHVVGRADAAEQVVEGGLSAGQPEPGGRRRGPAVSVDRPGRRAPASARPAGPTATATGRTRRPAGRGRAGGRAPPARRRRPAVTPSPPTAALGRRSSRTSPAAAGRVLAVGGELPPQGVGRRVDGGLGRRLGGPAGDGAGLAGRVPGAGRVAGSGGTRFARACPAQGESHQDGPRRKRTHRCPSQLACPLLPSMTVT